MVGIKSPFAAMPPDGPAQNDQRGEHARRRARRRRFERAFSTRALCCTFALPTPLSGVLYAPVEGGPMRTLILACAVMTFSLVAHPVRASGCSDAVSSYNESLDEISSRLRRYVSCVNAARAATIAAPSFDDFGPHTMISRVRLRRI